MSSGFGNQPRNRSNVGRDDRIVFQLIDGRPRNTTWAVRPDGTYFNTETGRDLTGPALDAARELDERTRDWEPQRENSESAARDTRTGMTDEQVGSRQSDLQQNAGERRTLMNQADNPMISFNSWGDAMASLSAPVRTANGMEISQVSARTARSLSAEDAARVYRDVFNHEPPANMSPQEALAEELRNTKR
jgi:hypothetical protein